jgi:hypothetical protein
VLCVAGEPLLTEATLSHITSMVAQHGSDVWWSASIEELLPAEVSHNNTTWHTRLCLFSHCGSDCAELTSLLAVAVMGCCQVRSLWLGAWSAWKLVAC